MSAQSIFSIASGLIDPPTTSTFTSAAAGTAVRASFSGPVVTGAVIGGVGRSPGATGGSGANELPPSTDISNSPVTAMYSAVNSVLAMQALPMPVAPTYGTPESPGSMPSATIPAAPLSYPQQSMIETESSANLSPAAKPAITVGQMPAFIDVSVADFDFEEIHPFNESIPSYEPLSAESIMAPERLMYVEDAGLVSKIKEVLSGSDVLSAAAQEMMFEAETQDIDREEVLALQKTMANFSAKGFSMPAGVINAEVAEIAYQGRVKRHEASFKVRDEAYKRARDKLVDAAAKAVALEAKHFAMHLSYVSKLIETLKFNAEMSVVLFNATVDLYNKKIGAIKTVVAAYKDYISSIKSRDAAIVDNIKAESYGLSRSKSEVDAYAAQVSTVRAMVDVETSDIEQKLLKIREYEAYLIGVKANTGIVKQNVEAFREAIRAYAVGVAAESEKFSAYAAHVSAEGSAAGVYSANVSAYSSFWRTEGARASAYGSQINNSVSVLNAEISEFRQYAAAHRSHLSAETARVSGQSSAASAFARAVRSGASYSSAYNRAQAAAASATNMLGLAQAEQTTRQQALDAQADAEQARIDAQRLAAQAHAAAGLAQAAYSVASSSVRVSGDASITKSGTWSTNTNYTDSATRSWATTRTTDADNPA